MSLHRAFQISPTRQREEAFMGKWGEKSKWAKAHFEPQDPLFMHKLRVANQKRARPSSSGNENEAARDDATAIATSRDVSDVVPFRCLRCGASVPLKRIPATGRPDPIPLAEHLETTCSAGAIHFEETQKDVRCEKDQRGAEDQKRIQELLAEQLAHSSESRMTVVWILLVNPKTPQNMGSVLRAMSVYRDGSAVLYSGNRYDIASKFSTDPHDAGSIIPKIHVLNVDIILDTIRQEALKLQKVARFVAVDLIADAVPLHVFSHDDMSKREAASTSPALLTRTVPDISVYVFGPEDGSIPPPVLRSCDCSVFVPTCGSMNLAASVNVLLYDRQAKRLSSTPADDLQRVIEEAQSTKNTNNHLRA